MLLGGEVLSFSRLSSIWLWNEHFCLASPSNMVDAGSSVEREVSPQPSPCLVDRRELVVCHDLLPSDEGDAGVSATTAWMTQPWKMSESCSVASRNSITSRSLSNRAWP